MELLGLIYGGLAILIIAILGLLFFVKNEKTNNRVISIIVAISLSMTLLSILSMPSNFIFERIVSAIIGAISLIGFGMRFWFKNYSNMPKLLVAISVVGTYVYMLFYMK